VLLAGALQVQVALTLFGVVDGMWTKPNLAGTARYDIKKLFTKNRFTLLYNL
jgi:hypothetical protein